MSPIKSGKRKRNPVTPARKHILQVSSSSSEMTSGSTTSPQVPGVGGVHAGVRPGKLISCNETATLTVFFCLFFDWQTNDLFLSIFDRMTPRRGPKERPRLPEGTSASADVPATTEERSPPGTPQLTQRARRGNPKVQLTPLSCLKRKFTAHQVSPLKLRKVIVSNSTTLLGWKKDKKVARRVKKAIHK